jgi:hypothetical protein
VGIYILRCKQLGFSFDDLMSISEGSMMDIIIESNNDCEKYAEKGTKVSFEAMFGG